MRRKKRAYEGKLTPSEERDLERINRELMSLRLRSRALSQERYRITNRATNRAFAPTSDEVRRGRHVD